MFKSRDQSLHCGDRLNRTESLSVEREERSQNHVLSVGNEVPGGASNRKWQSEGGPMLGCDD